MAAAQAADDLAEELGQKIDLLNLVDAATIYVIADSLDDVEEDQIVIMLEADDDLLELIDSFRSEVPNIDKRRAGGKSFEAWQLDDGDNETLFLYTQSNRNGTSIIATFNDDLLLDAIDIVNDDADSYRDAHGNAFKTANDALVFVVADVSAAPELDGPASRVLDFAKIVSAMITDQGDDLGVSLSITTDSTDNADQLGKLVGGLMAFAKFASAAEDDLDEEMAFVLGLLDSVETNIDGNNFTLSLDLPEELIQEFMENADF
jgi:hypothetical protein